MAKLMGKTLLSCSHYVRSWKPLFEEYKLKVVEGANVTPASSKKKDKGKTIQAMDVDESDLFKVIFHFLCLFIYFY